MILVTAMVSNHNMFRNAEFPSKIFLSAYIFFQNVSRDILEKTWIALLKRKKIGRLVSYNWCSGLFLGSLCDIPGQNLLQSTSLIPGGYSGYFGVGVRCAAGTLMLREPPSCGIDSNFRITAPPPSLSHFCQPTSSNSFPACVRFDQWEAPEIPMAEFGTQGRLYDRVKNLQINLRRKIVEDFIEEEGDFVTGNVSGWIESNLNMLTGKEFVDVG